VQPARARLKDSRRADSVTFLTHYYPPEVGAPQTRIHETARQLQRLGRRIQVVTGPPHYPDGKVRSGYSAYRPVRETIDGVPVVRLPVLVRPNRGIVSRTIDQGSFAASAIAALAILGETDVFVVESPPLFLGLTGAVVSALVRKPYVFHVADPWPDFPIAMGALRSPRVQRLAYQIERLAYERATRITTVSAGLCELIETKPGAAGKVRLLPNGVDLARFDPSVPPSARRRELGWDEARLTIAYVGSVGLAQGIGTLIEAVAPLASSGVVLRIVGGGYEREKLERAARAEGLHHVRFDPAIPAAMVPRVLGAADAVAVMLRRGPIYEHALPTKLVEGLAAGRPIIASADGDSARIVLEGRAGVVAPAENPLALRDAILTLMGEDLVSLGAAARGVARSGFAREVIVERLAGYLDEAVSGSVR
jgi:glycosyltransferase involved in cell wall biosynthesis